MKSAPLHVITASLVALALLCAPCAAQQAPPLVEPPRIGAAPETPAPAPVAVPPRPDGDFPRGDRPYARVDYQDTPVSAIMRQLSVMVPWHIVCTQAAGALRVNAYGQDMMVSDVIKAVVKAQGLAYRVEGNAVFIMTRDEFNLAYGADKIVIRLQHAPPETAVQALTSLLIDKSGKVAAIPGTSSIVIQDSAANLELMRRIVAEMDQPVANVVIPLANVAAADAVRTLQTFISPVGRISANESSNQVVISDVLGRIESLEKICRQLDSPSQRETRRFSLVNADAASVAAYLADMFGLRTSAAASEGVIRQRDSQRQGRGGDQQPQEQAAQAQPEMGAPGREAAMQGRRGGPGGAQTGAAAQGAAMGAQAGGAPAQRGAMAAQFQGAPGQMQQGGRWPGVYLAGASPFELSSAASQGTVVADSRTNSVWVTESPDRLAQIAEVVTGLDTPLETVAYRFNYIDPAAIGLEERLGRILTSPFDHYQVDSVSRRVTITTAPDRAARLRLLLDQWDVRPQQVLITGKILSVNRELLKEIGVTFDALVHQMDENIGTQIQPTLLFPPAIPAIPRGTLRIGDVDADNFTLIIDALEKDARSRLLASPRVLVIDGGQAQFTDATEQPYTEVSFVGRSETTVENVRFKDVGVTLTVAARVSGDDYIALDIMMDVSSLLEIRNGVPVVAASRLTTPVLVANGRPLVIGGLINDEESRTVNRVPVLGSLPVLGALFRYTRTSRSQRELVLIVVPTIVPNTPRVVEPTFDDIDARMKAAPYLQPGGPGTQPYLYFSDSAPSGDAAPRDAGAPDPEADDAEATDAFMTPQDAGAAP